MSMLADIKRKQKWSLNPRGKAWSEDSNKFGQKMLEKWGWKEGKGLGAKENGTKEHVKVSYKNDSKGMGFDETDGWTEHEANFTGLLQNLSGFIHSTPVESKASAEKTKSLEKKSQNSRVRVHYHKFTRGKDLSRYSEKDLANIFGKKTLKPDKIEESFKLPKNEKVETEEADVEGQNNFGVKTLRGGCMLDYFKKKMSNLGIVKDVDDNKKGGLVTYGLGFRNRSKEKDDECNEANGEERNDIDQHSNGFKTSKQQKKRSKDTFVSDVDSKTEESAINGIIKEINKSPKKRKSSGFEVHDAPQSKKLKTAAEEFVINKKESKNAKNKKLKESAIGIANPAFNPLHSEIKIRKHILNTIVEDDSEADASVEFGSILEESSSFKSPNGFCLNKQVNIIAKTNELDVLTNDQVDEVRSKKKKRKNHQNGLENPNFDADSITRNETNVLNGVEANPYEVKVKSKKKRQNKSDDSFAIDNPSFRSNPDSNGFFGVDLLEIEESEKGNNTFEVKRDMVKQKKKKKQKGIDNSSLCVVDKRDAGSNETGSIVVNLTDSNPYEVERKTKKAKRKHKKGLVNPCLNVTDLNFFELNKTSTEHGVNNPGLNLSYGEEKSTEDVQRNPKKAKNKSKSLNITNIAADVDSLQLLQNGLDNPGLNISHQGIPNSVETSIESNSNSHKYVDGYPTPISDSDIILNVTNEPDISLDANKNKNKFQQISTTPRRKSVRFSKFNDEIIIPNNYENQTQSPEDIANRNELFDINTKIIEDGLLEQETKKTRKNKEQMNGFVNNGFDIKSVDRNDFCSSHDNNNVEYGRWKQLNIGLDNGAFDRRVNKLQENLQAISNTMDRYQAEVENDINENKDRNGVISRTVVDFEETMVGSINGEDMAGEGVVLRFEHAMFNPKPIWHTRNQSATVAKRTYKHLICGDILLSFNNSNLHEIVGYGKQVGNRMSNNGR